MDRFDIKNKLNFTNYAIRDYTDNSEMDTNRMAINSSYVSTLNDLQCGYTSSDTNKYILHQKDNTNLLDGLWGYEAWAPPHYSFIPNSSAFARVGCAPIPYYGWGGGGYGDIRQITGGGYLLLTYYNNQLYYARPSSATTNVTFTAATSSYYANVVIIDIVGGGGGGGGGSSRNALLQSREAASGSGGGGGGWIRFLYKFDPDATSSNKTILCFSVGAGGSGGAGKDGATADDGGDGSPTTCYINSFSDSSKLCYVEGGNNGRGAKFNESGKLGGAGGRPGTGSLNSNTSACLIQSITGGAGGGGRQGSSAATDDGEAGERPGAAGNFANYTFSGIASFNATGTVYGTGSDPMDRDTTKNVSMSGGGGGASALSRGSQKDSGFGAHARYGLGGQGGSAWGHDTSDNGYSNGENGYPGGAFVTYTGRSTTYENSLNS